MIIPNPPVMLIADNEHSISECLRAGCRWVLLRDLNADDAALLAKAQRVKEICAAHDAQLFISRNIAIAKQIGADGVHLAAHQSIREAREACGTMMIGQSCHNVAELRSAEKNGADYISLSPIFETLSKPDYGPALGLQTLETLCKNITLPIIALGGIDQHNLKNCLHAGAKAVAIMGTILRSQTPKDSMRDILVIL